MADGKKKPTKAETNMKEQLFNLLTNDSDLLKQISEAVSTCIVEIIVQQDDFIKEICDQISKSSTLTCAIAQQLSGSVEQEVYSGIKMELEDQLTSLESKIMLLEDKNTSLIEEIDALEQYDRRNCLLIHGIPDAKKGIHEDTDELACKFFNEKLGLEIDKSDLDRSHRLNKKGAKPTPRPIIVKFAAYN